MIKRVLTTLATVALGSVAGHSLAVAQGYPVGTPSGYSIPADPNYPQAAIRPIRAPIARWTPCRISMRSTKMTRRPLAVAGR